MTGVGVGIGKSIWIESRTGIVMRIGMDIGMRIRTAIGMGIGQNNQAVPNYSYRQSWQLPKGPRHCKSYYINGCLKSEEQKKKGSSLGPQLFQCQRACSCLTPALLSGMQVEDKYQKSQY